MKKDYSQVINKIDAVASKIYTDFEKIEIPSLYLPTRTKANIKFDDKYNVWKYGTGTTEHCIYHQELLRNHHCKFP